MKGEFQKLKPTAARIGRYFLSPGETNKQANKKKLEQSQVKVTKKKKNESIQEFKNTTKRYNIRIMGVPEDAEKLGLKGFSLR